MVQSIDSFFWENFWTHIFYFSFWLWPKSLHLRISTGSYFFSFSILNSTPIRITVCHISTLSLFNEKCFSCFRGLPFWHWQNIPFTEVKLNKRTYEVLWGDLLSQRVNSWDLPKPTYLFCSETSFALNFAAKMTLNVFLV